QITGDKVTGDLYIAGMDENSGNGCTSGCGTNRNNKIYRSTDGGNTWSNTYTGPAFVGPCRSNSGFFCTMYSSPAYWRHMGWGEPAALTQGGVHVVSYVYSAKNGSDPGDVFYIRSTDQGVTFSAPFQLNTNTDVTKAQWQPNLSVSDAGTLFATWYDETPRTSASCQPSSGSNLCYQPARPSEYGNGPGKPFNGQRDSIEPGAYLQQRQCNDHLPLLHFARDDAGPADDAYRGWCI